MVRTRGKLWRGGSCTCSKGKRHHDYSDDAPPEKNDGVDFTILMNSKKRGHNRPVPAVKPYMEIGTPPFEARTDFRLKVVCYSTTDSFSSYIRLLPYPPVITGDTNKCRFSVVHSGRCEITVL